jgi:DedD protein
MDSRAKQRVTGAVILVALFVLLVPEIVNGPNGTPAPATPAEEGLRRYTIDLEAPGAAGNQSAVAEPSVNLPAVAEAPMAPSTGRAIPGEAAAPEAPAPAAMPPAAEAARPNVEPARPVPSTQPVQSASRPAPTTTPVRPAAATSPPPGSFVVQLGSFGSRENAERLVRDMTAKGFATFIAPITSNGRELYRVRVGPTRDRASAEALAAQLKRMGQSGSIVPIS